MTEFEYILNFLSEYQDLYGNELVLDVDRINRLMEEMPEFSIETLTPKKERKKKSTMQENRQPDSPLWQFRDEIKECTKCALHATRTNFVFGDGNPNADIMFIGEAPGAEEDRTGIPFVGRAGQLLNKLLEKIQLQRGDVFICNILKSRPPNNRDPRPEEVAACIPYLYRQIEIVKPNIIVALGRISAQNLLNTQEALGKMRNRRWKYRGIEMIVTYHPAAILRNPGLMDAATTDFKLIKELSAGTANPQS